MTGTGGWDEKSDPTKLTTEAVERAMRAEHERVAGLLAVIEQRFVGMDEATRLLSETVNRVPTEVQREIAHLKEVVNEKFDSVTIRFGERDAAVQAAFAAQKEAGSKQSEANSEAIGKLQDLSSTNIRGLESQISDLKDRVGAMESRKLGFTESRSQGAQQVSTTTALIGVVIAVVLAVITIYGVVTIGRDTTPTTPVVTIQSPTP